MGKGKDMEASSAINPKASKKAFAFSVEAMLAGFILFGILLYSSSLGLLATRSYLAYDPLSYSAQDLAAIGAKSGAWASVAAGNDSRARSLLDSLPPGLCIRAEIFRSGIDVSNLTWAYAPSNCTGTLDSKRAQAARPFIYRINSTDSQFYMARLTSWPRSG